MRVVALMLVAACGRIDFRAIPDACIPNCSTARCGDADGCGGTCELGAGCCVDECTVPAQSVSVRCVDGVQQMCAPVGACLSWTFDTPCTSGACVGGQQSNQCSYSGNCATNPIAMTFLAAPDGVTCAGPPGVAGLGETGTGAPLVIDGVDVAACAVFDFGSTCAPRQVDTNGSGLAADCTASCGSTCVPCGGFAGNEVGAEIFVSASLDLSRAWWIGPSTSPLAPNTGGSNTGISGFETRYVVVCRPACGSSGYSIAVNSVTLVN